MSKQQSHHAQPHIVWSITIRFNRQLMRMWRVKPNKHMYSPHLGVHIYGKLLYSAKWSSATDTFGWLWLEFHQGLLSKRIGGVRCVLSTATALPPVVMNNCCCWSVRTALAVFAGINLMCICVCTCSFPVVFFVFGWVIWMWVRARKRVTLAISPVARYNMWCGAVVGVDSMNPAKRLSECERGSEIVATY